MSSGGPSRRVRVLQCLRALPGRGAGALCRTLALPLLSAGLVACGGGRKVVPHPGMRFGSVPSLRGQSVMLLPVQIEDGVPTGLQPDAELAYALQERTPRVHWLLPDTLRRIAARNPAIQLPLEGLPVDVFLQAQVERVGDPLYGDLRRLNALTGAPLVLIPVRLRYRRNEQEVDGRTLEPTMELSAALVHVQSGRVLWFGIVDGEPGGANDPATLASAADALARIVAR